VALGAQAPQRKEYSWKNIQASEEGIKLFNESIEENPKQEKPFPRRPFCASSVLPLAVAGGSRCAG
jgi:hypothetical protein